MLHDLCVSPVSRVEPVSVARVVPFATQLEKLSRSFTQMKSYKMLSKYLLMLKLHNFRCRNRVIIESCYECFVSTFDRLFKMFAKLLIPVTQILVNIYAKRCFKNRKIKKKS